MSTAGYRRKNMEGYRSYSYCNVVAGEWRHTLLCFDLASIIRREVAWTTTIIVGGTEQKAVRYRRQTDVLAPNVIP